MRVIAGLAKGRKLKAPKGMTTRPTADRVKEAMFNILGHAVIDAVFLDLFAGSGAIGIEALSRGAGKCFFVESDRQALKIINENLTLTGLEGQSEVIPLDIIHALNHFGRSGLHFDIIFVDPPYLKGWEKKVLEKIHTGKIINKDGVVVIERSKRDLLPDSIGTLSLVREEKYGDTVLSFYKDRI